MQVMIELTVVFENPTIENMVLLTGPVDVLLDGQGGNDLLVSVFELRQQAEVKLGATLEDAQCFYRIFTRAD